MKDYYKILGVGEGSSDEQIKKAFKNIAKKEHPDRGGNEATFKEANEAYDTLKNKNKRQEYDTMKKYGASMGAGGQSYGGHFDEFVSGDFFDEFMSGIGGRGFRQRHRKRQNRDIRMSLSLSIKEIMKASKRTLSFKLPSGRDEIVEIKIPAGVQNGVTFRYNSIGDDSDAGVPRGNLLVKVIVLDSDGFTRKGSDLWSDRTITAFEAMRGCEFTIRDLEDNIVNVRAPAGTQPGSVLQLKSKGMPVHEKLNIRGNMYIKVHVTIPKLNERQLNKIKDL